MKILIFDPFALISNHSWPVSKLIKLLETQGVEVDIIACDEAFNFCTAMDSKKLEIDAPQEVKKEICTKCKFNREEFRSFLQGTKINTHLLSRLRDKSENFLDEEVKFNEWKAFYEPTIYYKKTQKNIEPVEKRRFEIAYENYIISKKFTESLLAEHEYDLALCYSPQYAAGTGFSEAALERNIKVLFMEGSSSPYNRYNSLRIWNWSTFGLQNPVSLKEDYAKARIRIGALIHFQILEKARTHLTYSIPAENLDVFNHLKIQKNRKILMAVVSSADEVYSAFAIGKFSEERSLSRVFENQIEWIKETIKFTNENPDFHLIVRLHPREWPNKRENLLSKSALEWEKLSETKLDNVTWVKPDANISIYDLYKIVNAVATGWSSSALEAMYRKIPVVTYDNKISGFPMSLTLTGNSVEEYRKNLQIALYSTRSSTYRKRVLRYISFRDFENTFYVGGSFLELPIFNIFYPLKRFFSFILRKIPQRSRNQLDLFFNQKRILKRKIIYFLKDEL